MALFMKQDFNPPIMTRKWIAMKFRPNMLLSSRDHIILILESGLLFREDSVEVEQEAPGAEDVWRAAGGGSSGWLTRGEQVVAAVLVGASVLLFPPRSLSNSSLTKVSAYTLVPVATRALSRRRAASPLPALVTCARKYLALARRCAAALRECAALQPKLTSISSTLEATRALLCRQQSELSVTMSRASSALLGNAPWLRSDLAWDVVERMGDEEDLMKIHHTFLVVQSTLLKHIAMAHFIPSVNAQRIYKNLNERIYWIHTALIPCLLKEFQDNYEPLERMYRLLKNYGNSELSELRPLKTSSKESWLYSEVHTGIAKANLELKIALKQCNSLDMFMDNCALNNQGIDVSVLNKDIDDLIDRITQCLNTTQNAQLRLKKMNNKLGFRTQDGGQGDSKMADEITEWERFLQIEDRDPEVKDEVFYYVKTDDDVEALQPACDVTTVPGKKEKENTKIVLNELKRKLVKREDLMRERERQALVKTMPGLKGKAPEFPRQINVENFEERKGFISKKNSIRNYKKKIRSHRMKTCKKLKFFAKKFAFKMEKYLYESDIELPTFETFNDLKMKSTILTSLTPIKDKIIITKWNELPLDLNDSSIMSGDLTDRLSEASNAVVNYAVNLQPPAQPDLIKFNKNDLDLSPSDSDSDFSLNSEASEGIELLNDVRKHRVARKKNFPVKWDRFSQKNTADESMKPVEYSFGTGMAMASVLQVNNGKLRNIEEEVFFGDGEVSSDSGNDNDI